RMVHRRSVVHQVALEAASLKGRYHRSMLNPSNRAVRQRWVKSCSPAFAGQKVKSPKMGLGGSPNVGYLDRRWACATVGSLQIIALRSPGAFYPIAAGWLYPAPRDGNSAYAAMLRDACCAGSSA